MSTAPPSPTRPRQGTSLRERKKLRTRQRLVATALDLFTERGFDGATLHDLCEAVEVSERTFFRNFAGKEDVVLTPSRDLWSACLEELETRSPDDASLMEFLQGALLAALDRMGDDGWTRQLLISQRLTEQTPSMVAHVRHFCDGASRTALGILHRRLKLSAPDDLATRLALDLLVASFNRSLDDWGARPGTPALADLKGHLRTAFAVLPGLHTLTVAARPGEEAERTA
ncbi:TetR family transcriptional regulator [Nocardiopsis sp. CT-R113]|uniref:TetR family transcriptional regulator n=1 Tax=Nocardiopsis codii TaxID=3065942 RepID=A0ABU7K5U7_9ACTN|nr:TetR family transcriptional regulator [Nocardiopsis sp. CT-R113]MEE2037623.1 TetR family transcriptional regulator [Nocardiopsis sp. CT-R113]